MGRWVQFGPSSSDPGTITFENYQSVMDNNGGEGRSPFGSTPFHRIAYRNLRFYDHDQSKDILTLDTEMSVASHLGVKVKDPSAAPSATNAGTQISDSNSGNIILSSGPSTSMANLQLFWNGNGLVGKIYTSGSSTSYATSSDHRLKTNVVPLRGALSRLGALAPKRFEFIKTPGEVVDGFLAHEVQAFVPNAASGVKDQVDKTGEPVYQTLDHSKLVPLLVAALQEANGRAHAADKAIGALKEENVALRTALERLTRRMEAAGL